MVILVCHVITQDHMVKEACDFMSGSVSCYVTILPSLVAIGIAVVKISF